MWEHFQKHSIARLYLLLSMCIKEDFFPEYSYMTVMWKENCILFNNLSFLFSHPNMAAILHLANKCLSGLSII